MPLDTLALALLSLMAKIIFRANETLADKSLYHQQYKDSVQVHSLLNNNYDPFVPITVAT